jgi:hypothetical protein
MFACFCPCCQFAFAAYWGIFLCPYWQCNLDLSFVQFNLQKDNASLGPHFFVSISNLPFWQFDLPIPIAFSFAFVGSWFWICHFGNLICKKMKLPFDLILLVSIGNLISVNKFDLLTQLRFIFAILSKMIRKKMMLLFVLILFVLPT